MPCEGNSNGGQKNNDMDDDSDDDAWSLDSLEREELELERKVNMLYSLSLACTYTLRVKFIQT